MTTPFFRCIRILPVLPICARAFGLALCGLGIGISTVTDASAEPVADRVYGQPNFTSGVSGNPLLPVTSQIKGVKGVGVTKDGVYISDDYSNRILFFPHGKTEATRLYGQAEFDTFRQNYRGLGPDSLAQPSYFGVSEAGLAIADWRNCRALFYPPNETRATIVYGQPHFYTNVPSYYSNPMQSIKYPSGATVDRHGGVYVSDSMNGRVVYFRPGSNVGQKSYTGTGKGSAQFFGYLQGVAVDNTGLYIADQQNNRVVFFPHGSAVATRVYGQPGFDTIGPNYPTLGAASLNRPSAVAVDSEGVYIADAGNGRVLYYPGVSTTASVVYGQKDFVSTGLGITASRMYAIAGVAADDTAVYVADAGGCRVLRFPKYNAPVANRLTISVQPSNGTAYVPLATQPVVHVLQSNGQVATGYNGPVILSAVSSGESVGPRIVGTTTVNAVNGIATFTDIAITSPGTFRLEAQAGTLTGAITDPVVIAPATQALPGADLNRDGVVDIRDTVLGLRVLMGVDAFPTD